MLVNRLPDHKPHESRASIRMDARLDTTTRQKVDDLAEHFHRPRAAVLCQIMPWGLSREQPVPLNQAESLGPVRHLSLYITSERHEHVQHAATATGVKGAPWLRHIVRQITIQDFPASWQEATPSDRSHDFRTYGKRFMLRLDEPTQIKLQQLTNQLGASKADIIRQLIAQATPETFPKSWHMRSAERHAQQPRQ